MVRPSLSSHPAAFSQTEYANKRQHEMLEFAVLFFVFFVVTVFLSGYNILCFYDMMLLRSYHGQATLPNM